MNDGFHKNYGTAYVEYKSVLGTICKSTSWSDVEADIFCKEVGYQYGGYSIDVSNHDLPRWITNVTCRGNETSLGNCSYTGWGQMDDCSDAPEAGAMCFEKSGKLLYKLFLFLDGYQCQKYEAQH